MDMDKFKNIVEPLIDGDKKGGMPNVNFMELLGNPSVMNLV